MIRQKASITTFLFSTRPNDDGKCSIKLNVYFNLRKKRYATNLHATPDEWEKLNAPNLRDTSLKELKRKLQAIVDEATKVADSLEPFSFTGFEADFFKKGKQVKSDITLTGNFNAYIEGLKKKDQIGTARSYQSTINSIQKFQTGLLIRDINIEWLQAYESYLQKQGKSAATMGIYMRQLRAIINQAVKAKIIPADSYPFGKNKYEIPSAGNTKKAISSEDVITLLAHKPVDPDHKKALDFWLLSYLCNGINFTDIANLKKTSIDGDFLKYIREKTKRTKKKDQTPIRVPLDSRALEIITKHQNTNAENPYLFPILNQNMDPNTMKNHCQYFIKWVNRRMKQISKDLKLNVSLNTYAARHTFSTVLMRNGAPVAYIKESLGHSSVAVTENYLASFDDKTKMTFNKFLTNPL